MPRSHGGRQNGGTNPLHYPAIAPERVTLTNALHRINDDAERASFGIAFAAGLNCRPKKQRPLSPWTKTRSPVWASTRSCPHSGSA